MTKMWTVTLAKSYSTAFEYTGTREYEVVADNAANASKRAIATDERFARREMDMPYRYVVGVKLIVTESV